MSGRSAQGKEGAEEKKRAEPPPDPMARHLQCPNCGKKLTNRSCKWWCACGYHESCADG